MNTPNDGDPVFPRGYHPEGNSADQGGMSLRDWFAGQALQGMLASAAIVDRTKINKIAWCASAYKWADTMLMVKKEQLVWNPQT